MPPRLVGSIADWSGKDAPDGRSWLLDHAQRMNFNAVWFSPFFETTRRQTVDGKGQTVSNSLYATRDHGAIDPEFSATQSFADREKMTDAERAAVDELDREHLEHFTKQAHAQGMSVMAMADLVFNHVASDHPAVLQENEEVEAFLKDAKDRGLNVVPRYARKPDGNPGPVIGMAAMPADGGPTPDKEMFFKFERGEQNFEVLNIGHTPGYDTAQINYASPAARAFFIDGEDGEEGYWKKVVDWCIDRGLKDFRCDIAYRLPPDWWQEIIEHARSKNPEATFMAETLGGPDDAIERMAQIRTKDAKGNDRPGFDLGMFSNYWWNFTDDWLPSSEAPRLERMAFYGGAASPDNHDTPETLAGHFSKALAHHKNRDKAVADICLRNYAVSAFMGNSVYMQMGYEYCKEKQNGVFKGDGSPAEWAALVSARAGGKSKLDLSKQIAGINAIKDALGVENCRVRIKEHREEQSGRLLRMSFEYVDVDTGQQKAAVTLLLNKRPEDSAVKVTDSTLNGLGAEGLQRSGGRDKNGHVMVDSFVVYHTPVNVPSVADITPPVAPARKNPPKPPAAAA
ncbi:MAG: hypothetical protein GC185_03995 [Alphaproteobacteria bacterium]|nr:hypothetical protein [Alphaproteobacteria bacterium]